MKHVLTLVTCLFFGVTASFAEIESDETPNEEVPMATAPANTSECRFGGSTRTIEIKYEAAPRRVPCRVLYTRDGQTQQLWQAQNVEGYCEEKAAGLADTLEAAGWSCG